MRYLFMKTKLNENHFYILMEMKMSQMIIGRQESHWKVYVYFHWSSIESQYMYVAAVQCTYSIIRILFGSLEDKLILFQRKHFHRITKILSKGSPSES